MTIILCLLQFFVSSLFIYLSDLSNLSISLSLSLTLSSFFVALETVSPCLLSSLGYIMRNHVLFSPAIRSIAVATYLLYLSIIISCVLPHTIFFKGGKQMKSSSFLFSSLRRLFLNVSLTLILVTHHLSSFLDYLPHFLFLFYPFFLIVSFSFLFFSLPKRQE